MTTVGSGDDLADGFRPTVGGVECFGTCGEAGELDPEVRELGDAAVDVDGMLVDESPDLGAGSVAAVPHGDDAVYLAEREPVGPGGADEREPVEGVVLVVAVAVGGPSGGREEAEAFVVTDCPGREPRLGGDVSDAHDRSVEAP